MHSPRSRLGESLDVLLSFLMMPWQSRRERRLRALIDREAALQDAQKKKLAAEQRFKRDQARRMDM